MKFKKYLMLTAVAINVSTCFGVDPVPTIASAQPTGVASGSKPEENIFPEDLFGDSKTIKIIELYNKLQEKNLPFSKNIQLQIRDGFLSAIKKTTTESSMEILKIIPTGVKGMTKGMAAIFFKLFTGMKPLQWNNLALLNNKVYRLVIPFTQVALGNLNREQRANQISSENNQDLTWLAIQKKVTRELDHSIMYLNKALIWYCPETRYSKTSFISRYAINFTNSFSTYDLQEISFYLKQTIDDIATLKTIIMDSKNLSEIQQKHDLIKRWLTSVCDDLEHISNFVDPQEPGKNNPGKINFMKLSAGNSQKASLEDLLSGGNGLASLAGMQ
ncbi:hypothetical protein M1446_02930 [Candidatus Dependentiae bacterium]|nr:hypothetical protein [Candidatus Dependentiae bacterium]